MTKNFLKLLLLMAIATIGLAAGAKSLAPAVTNITFCGTDAYGNEMTEDFVKGSDDVWRLNNYTVYGGTEFQLKLHINFNGDEYDEWYGCANGDEPLLKSAAPGTTVTCDIGRDIKNFRIGHTGSFSFTMNYDDIDIIQFGFEGTFEEARFLTGEFNNWGETQFTAWVGEYTLDIDMELEGKTMSGQFLIVDENYNYYGAATEMDYYTITQDNPTLNLATDAQDKKNLYLADEGSYHFIVSDDNVLTVSNWPVEVVTASLVGSTKPGWDMSNATVIPLTQDESTGYYTAANTPIPAGFDCQVLKHSSLSSVSDEWYGGTTGTGIIEIPEGGGDYDLMPMLGDNFKFTDNGKFTISVAPDFSEVKIYGIYTPATEYFLIGDFNNWDRDNKVPFTNQDGVSTLTHTFSGEFLIMDEYGNELGGATDEEHYWLHEDWPSVMLFSELQAANKKNIYVKDESEYTLTIVNGELTVSGWPVETISAWLIGSTNDQWEGNELNFKLVKDETTGNYVLGETSIPAGYRFQVVKRSSLSSVADTWYGANANADNDMFWVTDQTLGNIALNVNNKDIYFDRDGVFSFTVSPDFFNLNIEGEFDAEPGYYLIGDFNDWNEDNMEPFVKRDGAITLTKEFCGDFLIKDRDGNWIGANMGGDNPHFTFTANGNNVAITSNSDKKNFNVVLPSQYTLTISGNMLFVTGFPTEGYYMAGDFNEWKPEPMTKNGDGTYSIVSSIDEHNRFKFLDHEGNWYGGDTQGNSETYEIHNDWCTDILLTEGESGFNFIINTSGSYKFVLTEDGDHLKFSVVGFGFITLADALEGVSGTIEDELFVAAVYQSQVFVTNGTDWVLLASVYNADELKPGDCVDLTQTITNGFSGKGTWPTITIDSWVSFYNDDPQVPNIASYSLDEGFNPMPKPCQVVELEGWFFEDDMNALCANNGNDRGLTIELVDAEYANMANGRKYTIVAAIMLNEPWDIGATNAPHRTKPTDANATDNMMALVISATPIDVPTVVTGRLADPEIVSVKYVNPAGLTSNVPFDGINIVVTTHADGSTTVVKQLR
ncbi:MAG: hypothetical protein IKH19_03955 [Muribaculaceae bacterium]|nr:hypothetical protein [Muribaculaceae bacterium]